MSEGRIFAWTDWTDCRSVLRVLAWADTYHFIRLDGFSDQFRLDGLKIRPSVQKKYFAWTDLQSVHKEYLHF